jgi:hypothetical protein
MKTIKAQGLEILYCNLHFTYKQRKYKLKKVVYCKRNELYFNKRLTKEFKIKEPIKIDHIEIISSLGYQNKK